MDAARAAPWTHVGSLRPGPRIAISPAEMQRADGTWIPAEALTEMCNAPLSDRGARDRDWGKSVGSLQAAG